MNDRQILFVDDSNDIICMAKKFLVPRVQNLVSNTKLQFDITDKPLNALSLAELSVARLIEGSRSNYSRVL